MRCGSVFPVEPMAYPIVATSTGVLEDPVSTASVLDDDIDLSKARVEISFGSSPLAFVRGARRRLRIYPYYCSEQLASRILPLIALHRAGARAGTVVVQEDAAEQIQEAVQILTDRQQPTGANRLLAPELVDHPHRYRVRRPGSAGGEGCGLRGAGLGVDGDRRLSVGCVEWRVLGRRPGVPPLVVRSTVAPG